MTQGKIDKAVRIAINQFEKWNEVTGYFQEHSSYYYEILAVIEESVHIGIQSALDIKVKIGEDGNVVISKLPKSPKVVVKDLTQTPKNKFTDRITLINPLDIEYVRSLIEKYGDK